MTLPTVSSTWHDKGIYGIQETFIETFLLGLSGVVFM